MRQCTHARKGIVTNLPPSEPYISGTTHASRAVCDRPECIAAAIKWAAGETNQTANYYPDPQEIR